MKKEIFSMNDVVSVVESFLESVKQVSGYKGCVVINKKGKIISSDFNDKAQAEKITLIQSETLKYTNKLIREGRTGHFENILLEGSFGRIYIMPVQASTYYAAILGSESLNIGMIKAYY